MRSFPRPKSKRLWCWIGIALFFLLTSCGGEGPPTSVSPKGKGPLAEKKKAGTAKAVDKGEPGKKEEAEYVYNPAGKPDPFKPFFQLVPARDAARNIPLTPLQKYELSQLKMVAIIFNKEGSTALVEDSAGKGYFVKTGTAIGKNNGRVIKILKDRLIVEEQYEDILGQKKVSEIPMFLHRAEEGGEP
jgi:type IV pilus assembly protein PilP